MPPEKGIDNRDNSKKKAALAGPPLEDGELTLQEKIQIARAILLDKSILKELEEVLGEDEKVEVMKKLAPKQHKPSSGKVSVEAGKDTLSTSIEIN